MKNFFQKGDFFQPLLTGLLILSVLILTIFGSVGQNQKIKSLHADDEPAPKNEPAEENDTAVIYLNAIHIDTRSAEAKALRKPAGNYEGKRMHLVKFTGAIKPEWYKILTDAGAEVIDYIPNYTYLIFVTAQSLHQIQAEGKKLNSPIDWDGEYLPAYRISPEVYSKATKGIALNNSLAYTEFSVQLFRNENLNQETISFLKKIQQGNSLIDNQNISHYVNLVVTLSGEDLRQLSLRPDVISIQPYVRPEKQDESQAMIMTGQLTGNVPAPGNYLAYLGGKGFTQAQFDASGFVVNVTDDGLDSGSVANVLNPTSHFALFKNGDKSQASRVAFVHRQGTSTDADTKGCSGHGTLNSHIVGGYIPDALLTNSNHTDVNNFRYGLGIAPFVKVGNSTIFLTNGTYSNPNLANLESESYRDGGRISSNSWSANVAGAYNSSAQTFDFLVRDAQPTGSTQPTAGNQEMVIVFAAGNAGASGASTVGSPGTGKNVITVGASEGVRAFGGPDGCNITDAGANSANDIIGFSSRGPCTDGRKKPDIMAPGTHITGGNYQSNAVNPTSGTGSGAACFTGSSVCRGTAGSKYFPGTQQWTTSSSGTSHSCPAVAGFAALIRQDFINKSFAAPSPAMTKAAVLNCAGYMNGTGANDNLYSNNQGMGLVNMNNYFTAVNNPSLIRDQVAADLFTASAQTRSRTGVIANSSQPLRVTLAYTDAPGSTVGNAYVNNLDLEVTVNGTKYLGNVFTGANSVAGGVADVRNNVESVFLPAGFTGSILVKVIATNIAGDGIPNSGTALDQDYALIISNFTEQPAAVVSSPGPSITAESCGTGLVPDPREQLTVSLPITNDGTVAFGNLIATLQSSSDIVNPTGAQSYGALTPGASDSKTFSFFVNSTVPCGNVITLIWNLTDGAANAGTIVKTYDVGTTVNTLSQNFDGVTAPALPAGWAQTQISGTAINWVTSVTTPNSAPNTAFANNPSTANATALESPVFTVTGSNATVSFQKAYTTENTYDGVVFEIKIGVGAWTDILAAGGSFTTGGYNTVIVGGATGSVIIGRAVWSGNFPAYTLTQVMLPATALNQNVQVRWLMVSDNTIGGTGFRLDDVVINATAACSPCNTLPLNLLSFIGSKQQGFNLLQWRTANETDTKTFEVEYSHSGNEFKKAYSVRAAGSGNNSYEQKDNGAWIKSGLIFYRLKMTDLDGQFSYSNTIKIRNNSAEGSSLYPNPAKNMVTVFIGDRNLLGTKMQLLDVTGKLLEIIPIRYLTIQTDISKYQSGTYLIKLENGETLRLIKL